MPPTTSNHQTASSHSSQDDVLLPQMTVWETLQLAAALVPPPLHSSTGSKGKGKGQMGHGEEGEGTSAATAKTNSGVLDLTSKQGAEARCESVLVAMGLARQRHTLVGGTLPGGLLLRGISGGWTHLGAFMQGPFWGRHASAACCALHALRRMVGGECP